MRALYPSAPPDRIAACRRRGRPEGRGPTATDSRRQCYDEPLLSVFWRMSSTAPECRSIRLGALVNGQRQSVRTSVCSVCRSRAPAPPTSGDGRDEEPGHGDCRARPASGRKCFDLRALNGHPWRPPLRQPADARQLRPPRRDWMSKRSTQCGTPDVEQSRISYAQYVPRTTGRRMETIAHAISCGSRRPGQGVGHHPSG
jgi:hypothetical protein